MRTTGQKLREDASINATKLGFMLPSVGPGGFTKVQTTTEELAVHLREILVKWGIPPAEACGVASR